MKPIIKFCNLCGQRISYVKFKDAQKRGWEPLCTNCIVKRRTKVGDKS